MVDKAENQEEERKQFNSFEGMMLHILTKHFGPGKTA